jgi:hypothetical protein
MIPPLKKRETRMIKLNNEAAELALSDLDNVVGGGKIGDAARQTSLFKAASDLGQAATQNTLPGIGNLIADIIQH